MTAKEMYKLEREHTIEMRTKLDESMASFFLSLPMPMSYEVWWFLHSIKGDLE